MKSCLIAPYDCFLMRTSNLLPPVPQDAILSMDLLNCIGRLWFTCQELTLPRNKCLKCFGTMQSNTLHKWWIWFLGNTVLSWHPPSCSSMARAWIQELGFLSSPSATFITRRTATPCAPSTKPIPWMASSLAGLLHQCSACLQSPKPDILWTGKLPSQSVLSSFVSKSYHYVL